MKRKIVGRWYIPQILKEGEWTDIINVSLTSREARKEIRLVNCFGYKARVIECAERVVYEKDFTD